MLKINNLCFGYIKKPFCIKDLNLTLRKGQALLVIGGEGMGKTSFLKLISGLEKQYAGSIKLNGKELNEIDVKDRNISYLPTEPIFFENKSVLYNLKYLYEVINKPFDVIEINNLLKTFGLDINLSVKVKKLTIVNKRVLAILRAYIKNADLVLIDDQFCDIDKENIQKIKNAILLLKQVKNNDKTFIFVQNSLNLTNYDNILYMSYSKNYQLNSIKDLETNPIDGFAKNYVNFNEYNRIITKQNSDYLLCEYDEIYDKKRKNTQITLKNIVKIPKIHNNSLEYLSLKENDIYRVLLLSKNVINIDESALENQLNDSLFMFDGDTKSRMLI